MVTTSFLAALAASHPAQALTFQQLLDDFTLNNLGRFLTPYLVSVVVAIVIFVVGKWLARRLTNLAVHMIHRFNDDEILCSFIGQFIYFGLLLFVILLALSRLGVDSGSLIAILGAAGLAIGLALQGSLQNFAAGLMIMIFKPFRKGHYVEVGGVSGTVSRVGLLLLELVTPDNRTVLLPNGKVFQSEIVNYHLKDTRRVDLVMDVAYGADIHKAKTICERILAEDARVLQDPAPVIAVGELAESSIRILVRPWTSVNDYWNVKWDLTEKMLAAFDEAGVEIPFNQLDINLRTDVDLKSTHGVTFCAMDGNKRETDSGDDVKNS